MDENTLIRALPLYKKLIEEAGKADDRINAPGKGSLDNDKNRGQYSAFLKAAEMVKESTK